MKQLLIIIILLFWGGAAFSQQTIFASCPRQYSVFAVGPYASALSAFISVKPEESRVEYGYGFGGRFQIRPVERVSLTSGLAYNKIGDIARFYDLPIVLNYHAERNIVASAGPALFFDVRDNSIGSATPEIGLIAGLRYRSTGIQFIFLPENIVFDEDIGEIERFIGLGVSMSIMFSFF